MGWADALVTFSEAAGRNLCRPGWPELLAVVILACIAGVVGCCCGQCIGSGWGFCAGFAAGRADRLPTPSEVIQVAQRTRQKLRLYNGTRNV